MREKAMRQLQDAYARFLRDIEKDAPGLMGDKYSNPYFISIPEKWFEEGFGTYGCGKQGKAD